MYIRIGMHGNVQRQHHDYISQPRLTNSAPCSYTRTIREQHSRHKVLFYILRTKPVTPLYMSIVSHVLSPLRPSSGPEGRRIARRSAMTEAAPPADRGHPAQEGINKQGQYN